MDYIVTTHHVSGREVESTFDNHLDAVEAFADASDMPSAAWVSLIFPNGAERMWSADRG